MEHFLLVPTHLQVGVHLDRTYLGHGSSVGVVSVCGQDESRAVGSLYMQTRVHPHWLHGYPKEGEKRTQMWISE